MSGFDDWERARGRQHARDAGETLARIGAACDELVVRELDALATAAHRRGSELLRQLRRDHHARDAAREMIALAEDLERALDLIDRAAALPDRTITDGTEHDADTDPLDKEPPARRAALRRSD